MNSIGARWHPITTAGDAPSRRDCHTMVLHEGSIYLFGGWDGTECLSDVHQFDLSLQTWSALPCSAPPPAREGHSAVAYKHEMVVFGGQGAQIYNDCHLFDFSKHTWREMKAVGQLDSYSSTDSLSSAVPSPRFYHTAVVFRDEMYVFGGCDEQHYFGELYALSLISASWRKEYAVGQGPGRRYCHSSVVYLDGMYVFGGCEDDTNFNDCYLYQFATSHWSHVVYRSGLPPTPRYSQVCVVDEHANLMVVFGGCVESCKFNTGYVFCMSEWRWFPIVAPESIPVAGHSCVYAGGKLFIFGGCGDEEAYNQLYELALCPQFMLTRQEGSVCVVVPTHAESDDGGISDSEDDSAEESSASPSRMSLSTQTDLIDIVPQASLPIPASAAQVLDLQKQLHRYHQQVRDNFNALQDQRTEDALALEGRMVEWVQQCTPQTHLLANLTSELSRLHAKVDTLMKS
eukprot:NODE_1765_length_1389_cov_60.202853_g1676_i0.p1 GENE.NODE_1765_length_1389_cov_60.202853_g1676_i0~~NODE_1765_length_1389_cov_60.202853_g1676_i0.p1  ORF type:complete len:458 (+),score=95.52 NODE_1765_length_1389_cov_60.202853_g1676_i0:13-1386(+)